MTVYQRIVESEWGWYWKENDRLEIIEVSNGMCKFRDYVGRKHIVKLYNGKYGKYFRYGTTYYVERKM